MLYPRHCGEGLSTCFSGFQDSGGGWHPDCTELGLKLSQSLETLLPPLKGKGYRQPWSSPHSCLYVPEKKQRHWTGRY